MFTSESEERENSTRVSIGVNRVCEEGNDDRVILPSVTDETPIGGRE
jgi:hypothetical protein